MSKEDAILSKLLWTSRGSSKSRDDVVGMLLDPGAIDERHRRQLAEGLGCAALRKRFDPGWRSSGRLPFDQRGTRIINSSTSLVAPRVSTGWTESVVNSSSSSARMVARTA